MSLPAYRAIFVLTTAALLGACDNASPPASTDGVPASPSTAVDTSVVAVPPSMVALQAYTATPATPGGNCALDVVNGAAETSTAVSSGSDINLSGWVADAQNNVPGDAMLVLTGTTSSYAGSLPTGGDRPDVASALGSDTAQGSGFNAMASLAGIEAGEYVLSVVHGGATPQSCALNKRLVIAAGT